MEDNSHAGQGPVLLDIGGDIGALIVTMPAALEGIEIEIRPTGYDYSTRSDQHDHGHDHSHDHSHDPRHGHGPAHLPHVAVVGRPMKGRVVHSAVFGELASGRYELYVRPDGPVRLTAQVAGGEVTEAIWPT
ncbi:MAG TPA: hypothetical protein VGH11_12845 [Jatrophihabitans sp.]|jgi:hypothetical protein